VDKALVQLQFTNKKPADLVAKVIKSAAANYRDKYETNIDNSELVIKSITVDSVSMLKRIQPAPQGRAHLIRKRSSHINVVVAPVETDNQVTEE
jgi:large subunit ribosomal protein L22